MRIRDFVFADQVRTYRGKGVPALDPEEVAAPEPPCRDVDEVEVAKHVVKSLFGFYIGGLFANDYAQFGLVMEYVGLGLWQDDGVSRANDGVA